MGVAGVAEEVWGDGGPGEEETRICVVPCDGGWCSGVMGTSGRPSSSFAWAILKMLLGGGMMSVESSTVEAIRMRHTMVGSELVKSEVELVMGR
jgi:hypothetical protein